MCQKVDLGSIPLPSDSVESLSPLRKESYLSTSTPLDNTVTFKWRINNFALLTMRHSELRSPEFEGPRGTRWVGVLVLGDPRLKKAEERSVETQLYLVHCPDECVGQRVLAGHQLLGTDDLFAACGRVDVELTHGLTKAADPNTVQHCWVYPSNMTTLFTDKCSDNGTLRMVISIAFDVSQIEIRVERRLRFPVAFSHYLKDMTFLNDLFFLTAESQRVPAHKAYMREVSPVLRETIDAMGGAQEYCLKQFHAPAVTAFVMYCYTGLLHESFIRGYGVEVLKLGHVFNVPGVIMESADYCFRNIESEGEVRCFKIASEYGAHVALKKMAVLGIARRYGEVIGTLPDILTHHEITELQHLLSELKSCNGCF